jgi:hypothetical protein
VDCIAHEDGQRCEEGWRCKLAGMLRHLDLRWRQLLEAIEQPMARGVTAPRAWGVDVKCGGHGTEEQPVDGSDLQLGVVAPVDVEAMGMTQIWADAWWSLSWPGRSGGPG